MWYIVQVHAWLQIWVPRIGKYYYTRNRSLGVDGSSPWVQDMRFFEMTELNICNIVFETRVSGRQDK